jgi:hypothetical protein
VLQQVEAEGAGHVTTVPAGRPVLDDGARGGLRSPDGRSRPGPYLERRVSTILLLIISILAPWVVHLAAPRQRALALVGVLAVFLLYGIFAENPLTQWEMWAGLAAGVLTVLFLVGGGIGGSGGGRSRPRRTRPSSYDEGNEPTGEI